MLICTCVLFLLLWRATLLLILVTSCSLQAVREIKMQTEMENMCRTTARRNEREREAEDGEIARARVRERAREREIKRDRKSGEGRKKECRRWRVKIVGCGGRAESGEKGNQALREEARERERERKQNNNTHSSTPKPSAVSQWAS